MLDTIRTSATYQRARTFADLHFYQKWHSVWPHLAVLPREGVRLLDAGCGDGRWSAEIARRRPGWIVTGVDRDEAAVESARAHREDLGLSNVSFEAADFLEFQPNRPCDVVISICSTHYGSTLAETEHLFQHMHEWLAPAGQLVLLVPRRVAEAPFVAKLVRPEWHDRFSRDTLARLCEVSGLTPALIAPRVGRIGTLAKQLDWTRTEVSAPAASALCVLAKGVAFVDAHVPSRSSRSLMWLVIARRRTDS